MLALSRYDVEQTIPARFEAVVRQVPDRLALSGDGRSWTYAELNRDANRLAHAIRARTPPGPGRVAFLIDQSPEMVIAVLAVLKAGKTYVALHPRMPAEAREAIVRDVEPDLVLTAESLHDWCRASSQLAPEPSDNPSRDTSPRDPSTLFYTSGSTGQPKGVIKSHRAVLHRVWLSAQHDAIAIDDRQSLLTHCSFSASESDMFGALLQGAAVCTFDIASHGFAEFTSWLESERITLLHPPVLFFRRFLSTLETGHVFPNVRIVALAGDVVLPADLQQWKEHFTPRCVVLHRFSITETALLTVSRFEHGSDPGGAIVEAGLPVAGKTLKLIDANGAEVPRGETGELVVQSDYLSDGYWNRPDETAKAFGIDPITGQRTYRTGDLGRFSPDGTFTFLGRRDGQLKIRGYRVEIREIEAALLQLDGVREAVCAPWKDNGEQRLRAFIAWNEGRALDAKAIRGQLRSRLPEWKIPDDFQSIDALPTTLTGKADRRSLAEQTRGNEIAAIWSHILGKSVDIDDAFFDDLGGTSLDALAIVNAIERTAGRRLPLSLLIELNTPRKMADYLAANPDRERTIIALRREGSRPPLFCVSGKGGSVIVFRALAEALGAEQPFFGLTYHGIDPQSLPASLAALAACYVDAIRAQQPEGPYHLAGYSAGGLIAFEIARQLAHAGQRVAFVGLLDTAATQRRASIWKRYRKYVPIFRRRPASTFVRIARGIRWRAAFVAEWVHTGNKPRHPERIENRFYDSLDLQSSVRPYAGPVTLFLAREGTGSECALPDAGWSRLCERVEIVPIDGEHHTILSSDVAELARGMSRALANAQNVSPIACSSAVR